MHRLRRTLPALLLAAVLPLSGCAAILDRSQSSMEAHVDYPAAEDDSTLRVETYQGLVNAILYFVNEHSATGSMRLYNYAGDAEEDLERACAAVMEQDPLAAYAVEELNYGVTRILTYYEVELRVSYAHSAEALESIRSLSGQSALRGELARMAAGRLEQSTVLLSYFSGGTELVEELFLLARCADPAHYLDTERPSFTAVFYPEEGARRVAELTAVWGEPAAGEDYPQQLADAASRLLESAPPAGGSYTPEELAALLRSAAVYREDGSDLALDALTGRPASLLGLALGMEYLCQRAGVEVNPVAGSGGSGIWLMVSTPGGYRHLLPQDLISPAPLPLYTDTALDLMGYAWNASLYHACVDISPPEPPPEPSPAPSQEPVPDPSQDPNQGPSPDPSQDPPQEPSPDPSPGPSDSPEEPSGAPGGELPPEGPSPTPSPEPSPAPSGEPSPGLPPEPSPESVPSPAGEDP